MATKKPQKMMPIPEDKDARKKALGTAIAQLERNYGEGTIRSEEHTSELQSL